MESIFNQYGWSVITVQQLHQGLINSTYSITTNQGDFILQTVNHHIFKDPFAIDANINAIGKFLKQQAPDYEFTHLIPTLNGKTLVEWEGKFYRAFKKMKGYSLSVLDNSTQAKEAANQFGKFTQVLSEFNIRNLKITLPDFHNLSLRYYQFTDALIKGNKKRIDASQEAILYLQSKQPLVTKFENFITHPEALNRVTHHDTKISNVIFNKNNDGVEKAICVIDLDTVMPGYFISDLGDMCRTYLCPVSEEATDLNLIQIEKGRWENLKDGYLASMQNALTNFELDHFIFAGQFIIYMQALRFLTDHLNNDTYYGAKYDNHNYNRAINQIALLEKYEASIVN
jgi:Ser/Thr protein kinase RdoA (MazF antagonist)